jgi:hypothetical protein
MGAVVVYRDCVARPLARAPRDIVPVPPDGADHLSASTAGREVFRPSQACATDASPELVEPRRGRESMITYRTRLFDMRLDDLWDPHQRWALLSDTASKHSRTDPVVFLYQNYFRPARLLAIHVDESARVQQQEVQEYRCRGRDKPSDGVTCERTDCRVGLVPIRNLCSV